MGGPLQPAPRWEKVHLPRAFGTGPHFLPHLRPPWVKANATAIISTKWYELQPTENRLSPPWGKRPCPALSGTPYLGPRRWLQWRSWRWRSASSTKTRDPFRRRVPPRATW